MASILIADAINVQTTINNVIIHITEAFRSVSISIVYKKFCPVQ